MIIAIDIDNTICKEQKHWWLYEEGIPIPENIEKINKMYDEGHIIIYYSARFEEDKEVTEKWFKRNGVKYHRLVLGKLKADLYIDNDSKRLDEL
jgi:uncharacterized HAD superfamily protein